MKPIRIFRHIECEGPGSLADVLDDAGVPYEIVAVDQNHPVPPQVNDVSGLVFMGGPMSVNDSLPWIEQECRLIRHAVKQNIPVLGHCLGGQLICKALGGEVGPNPVREIGWFPVRRIVGEAADNWLGDLPQEFIAFHWHGETFSIPPGAAHLLESELCPHQGFAIGATLALQCHVEMTAPMVREWADRYRDELVQPSSSVQSAQSMVEDVEKRANSLQQTARVLYRRWLEGVRRS